MKRRYLIDMKDSHFFYLCMAIAILWAMLGLPMCSGGMFNPGSPVP